jgi:hypothetical protein
VNLGAPHADISPLGLFEVADFVGPGTNASGAARSAL